MKPKLFRAAVLALALAVSVLLAPSALAEGLAADTSADITISAAQGDTLTITLQLDAPAASALRCSVGYDAALLSLRGAEIIPAGDTDLTGSVTSHKATAQKEGRITMLWYDLDHTFAGGDLLTLTFVTRAEMASTTLTLTGLELVDGQGTALTAAGAGFSAANGHAPLPGDANNDGAVNVVDMAYLQKSIAGIAGTVINTAAVDLNSDGNVNIMDLAILQKGIAGLVTLQTAGSGYFVCG